jgi:hypothetical protein
MTADEWYRPLPSFGTMKATNPSKPKTDALPVCVPVVGRSLFGIQDKSVPVTLRSMSLLMVTSPMPLPIL